MAGPITAAEARLASTFGPTPESMEVEFPFAVRWGLATPVADDDNSDIIFFPPAEEETSFWDHGVLTPAATTQVASLTAENAQLRERLAAAEALAARRTDFFLDSREEVHDAEAEAARQRQTSAHLRRQLMRHARRAGAATAERDAALADLAAANTTIASLREHRARRARQLRNEPSTTTTENIAADLAVRLEMARATTEALERQQADDAETIRRQAARLDELENDLEGSATRVRLLQAWNEQDERSIQALEMRLRDANEIAVHTEARLAWDAVAMVDAAEDSEEEGGPRAWF